MYALDYQLSTHFVLREFVKSETSVRLGLDNTPSDTVIEALQLLCVKVLEPIREAHGRVKILSGYRSHALNEALKGSSTSDHVKGLAADIEVPALSNADLGKWIVKNVFEWDQLIYEFTRPKRASNVPADPFAGWIHVSYRPNANRKMVLYKD